MTHGPGRVGHLRIVGAGRVGLALATALHRAGAADALTLSGRRDAPPAHPLLDGGAPAAAWLGASYAVPADAAGVLLAVPDRAIPDVVARLADSVLPPGIPFLHAGGSLDAGALAPLRALGHPVGSVHPLAAVADPVAGAERLRGASFGVEGDGAARGLALAIVAACGGTPLEVAAGGKPLYHAAAVFASNYAVALLSVAERLMERAGVPAESARPALAALVAGAVANVAERGPAAALTGPVARGDDATVALHLARLSGDERALYSLLGREALALAAAAGLDGNAEERLRSRLGEGT